jgi:hypothetical protein
MTPLRRGTRRHWVRVDSCPDCANANMLCRTYRGHARQWQDYAVVGLYPFTRLGSDGDAVLLCCWYARWIAEYLLSEWQEVCRLLDSSLPSH